MTTQFPTEAQLLARGFIKAPASRETGLGVTATLYTHPRSPGMLFKRVASLSSALACGGFATVGFNTTSTDFVGMIKFGGYANASYHANRLTSVCVPDQLTIKRTGSEAKFIGGAGFNEIQSNETSANGEYRWAEVLSSGMATVRTGKWFDIPELDSHFILGVISKATDGCMLRLSVDPGVVNGVLVPESPDAYVEGTLTNNAIVKLWQQVHAGTADGLYPTCRVAAPGFWYGYVEMGIEFDVPAYVSGRKSAVLAVVDASARSVYSTAWDEIVHEYPPTKQLLGVRVYPRAGDGELVARASWGQPVVTGSGVAHYENRGWFSRFVADPAGGPSFTAPSDSEVAARNSAVVHMRWPDQYSRAGLGVQLPVIFANIGYGVSGTSGPLVEAASINRDAANLPVRTVVIGGEVRPAGDVLGGISPLLAKPATAELGSELSVDNFLKADLARISTAENPSLMAVVSDSGQTPTQRQQLYDSSEASELRRQALVLAMLPSVSMVARELCLFINRVDARSIVVAKR